MVCLGIWCMWHSCSAIISVKASLMFFNVFLYLNFCGPHKLQKLYGIIDYALHFQVSVLYFPSQICPKL